jgi:hypothetical protein
MRTLIAGLLTVGLLVGCASKPADEPVTKRVKVDASNIAEAQAAGYRIVNKDGQTLYCRKEFLTGSRLKTRTSCLTAAQWATMNESARSFVRDTMSRPAHVGGHSN